jgi:heme-degrading monooxygenase HmoA
MFARVVTIQGKPDKVDAAIANVRDESLPKLKKMAGFKGMYLLVDRKTGKNLVVAFWESEKALQDSVAATAPFRAQGAQAAGATNPPIVEAYEVAIKP